MIIFFKQLRMNKEEFLINFTNLFEETEVSQITLQTNFRDLKEWSSLLTLSTIAMCDEEYGLKITTKEITGAHSVEDLFNLLNNKN